MVDGADGMAAVYWKRERGLMMRGYRVECCGIGDRYRSLGWDCECISRGPSGGGGRKDKVWDGVGIRYWD